MTHNDPASTNEKRTGPRGSLSSKHIWGGVGVGILVVGGAIAVAWGLASPTSHDEWADSIRSAVLAAGAVAAVPAGYVAYRKQQTAELVRDDEREKQQHVVAQAAIDNARADYLEQQRREELALATQRADAKDYRDRYAAAAGQLGSDKAAIRLAGVYALVQLADEWGQSEQEQRQVCIDVLCGYLRMPWPGRTDDREESEIRAAILRTVASRLQSDRPEPAAWWTNDFDLTGAHLPSVNFAGVRLDGEFTAESARFDGPTVFEDARFSKNANFNRAVFTGPVDFGQTLFLRNASFYEAVFESEASFQETQFKATASFINAIFEKDATFEQATYSSIASYGDTKFRADVRFCDAWFARRPAFRHATVKGDVHLDGVTGRRAFSVDAGTVFGDVIQSDGRHQRPDSTDARLLEFTIPEGAGPSNWSTDAKA